MEQRTIDLNHSLKRVDWNKSLLLKIIWRYEVVKLLFMLDNTFDMANSLVKYTLLTTIQNSFTDLVQSTSKVDNDLASSVIINDLELTNVT